MKESFDVIIIGAGASGLASGWYLCKEGLKVAIFEQGDLLSEDDYIPINKGGEIQKFKELNDNPNIRKKDFDYLINTDNSPIDISNYNGIGGSTILFSGHYPRFQKSDFSTYTNDKVGVDWPIDYTILKKYYEINDTITGVAGVVGNSKYPDIKDLLPPIPLGKMGYTLAKGFRKLNWHWWPSYSAINTIPYNNRPADDYQRPSNLGNTNMSKGSANNTYFPLAKSEGIIIKKNCTVSKLICENNEIKNIDYIDSDGSLNQAKAKLTSDSHVFSCFVSPSGDGLKVVLKVPTEIENHAASWATAAKRVESLTGIKPDNGNDLARLCFVSYDSSAYHNPKVLELEVETEKVICNEIYP